MRVCLWDWWQRSVKTSRPDRTRIINCHSQTNAQRFNNRANDYSFTMQTQSHNFPTDIQVSDRTQHSQSITNAKVCRMGPPFEPFVCHWVVIQSPSVHALSYFSSHYYDDRTWADTTGLSSGVGSIIGVACVAIAPPAKCSNIVARVFSGLNTVYGSPTHPCIIDTIITFLRDGITRMHTWAGFCGTFSFAYTVGVICEFAMVNRFLLAYNNRWIDSNAQLKSQEWTCTFGYALMLYNCLAFL